MESSVTLKQTKGTSGNGDDEGEDENGDNAVVIAHHAGTGVVANRADEDSGRPGVAEPR